jgi:hypothetical protein
MIRRSIEKCQRSLAGSSNKDRATDGRTTAVDNPAAGARPSTKAASTCLYTPSTPPPPPSPCPSPAPVQWRISGRSQRLAALGGSKRFHRSSNLFFGGGRGREIDCFRPPPPPPYKIKAGRNPPHIHPITPNTITSMLYSQALGVPVLAARVPLPGQRLVARLDPHLR